MKKEVYRTMTLPKYSPLSHILNASVDWITATSREMSRASELTQLALEIETAEAKRGQTFYPWQMSGFIGLKRGQLQFGLRDLDAIIRLSGSLADTKWRDVLDCADNVSRLDLAVTVQLPADEPRLAANYFADKVQQSARKNAPTYALHTTTRGGDTLYVGRRSSNYYGRVYDKMRESANNPVYENAWRYEVEIKSDAALQTARELIMRSDTHSAIIATVFDYFHQRGIEPRFERSADTSALTNHTTPSDEDAQLTWLAASVMPTLGRLAQGSRADKLIAMLQEILPAGMAILPTVQGRNDFRNEGS